MIFKVHIHYGSLLIILVIARISSGQNPPVISDFLNSDISNHAIELKEGISLECDGRGQPEPKYKWFHNEVEVQEELEGSGDETDLPTRTLTDANQVITFKDVAGKENLKGYYHCEAENEHGTAKSEVIFVTDVLPQSLDDEGWTIPKFTDGGPKPQIVPYEQPTKLECTANGDPTPDIIWTKDGTKIDFRYEISHRGQVKLDTSTNSLTVNSVTEETVGTYACNATNRAGYVYKSVPINILKRPPVITEKPTSKNISIGMKAIIRCTVVGYPEPTTSWKFNGVDVTTLGAGKLIVAPQPKYEVMPDGGLTINSIKQADSGNYTCSATNSEGDISETVQLGVVTQTTIDNGPAGEQKMIIHETVKFDCSVLYDPTYDLTVEWKKDNNDVDEDDSRITVDRASIGNQALTITDLTYDDAGTYTCIAQTQATGIDTASGDLKVEGIKPKIKGSTHTDQFLSEGDELHVLCKYDGDPTPSQLWYKNASRIEFEDGVWTQNDRISLNEDGSLVISDAKIEEDNGKYICRAENKYGFETASSFVTVTKRTVLNTESKDLLFDEGSSVSFDCDADIDKKLEDSGKMNIEWFREDEKINFLEVEIIEIENCTNDKNNSPEYEDTDSDLESGPDPGCWQKRIVLHENNSITILETTKEDVGDYKCVVNTGVESPLTVYHYYHEPRDWMWVIILIAIIVAVLVLILCILCIICCRKRATKNGTYDVHPDEDDGRRQKKNSKNNTSEIQYSIDDEIEGILPDSNVDGQLTSSGKKPKKKSGGPIFRPKTSKGGKGGSYTGVPSHSNGTAASKNIGGSENSLLEEDDWLRRGMDEDGSFREGRYAE